MTEVLPKAVAENTMTMLGVTLRCYVLDDGRRVFNQEDCERFFAILFDEATPALPESEMMKLVAFVKGLN
jgi:hypothetical protein